MVSYGFLWLPMASYGFRASIISNNMFHVLLSLISWIFIWFPLVSYGFRADNIFIYMFHVLIQRVSNFGFRVVSGNRFPVILMIMISYGFLIMS